jgi:hypothetical protein
MGNGSAETGIRKYNQEYGYHVREKFKFTC